MKSMSPARRGTSSYPLIILREIIEFFITSFEKAQEEVKGKNPKIVMITSAEVRKAAELISRERRSQESRS